jgi:hypothetical protein
MTEKQADDQFKPMMPAVSACYATRLGGRA